MTTGSPERQLLEAVHEFPGNYTLKAFGPHEQEFVDGITAAAEGVHVGDAPVEVSARASAQGNHVCVTVTIRVDSADGVFALYAAVREVGGLRMLL